jgi:glycosyltransferase involved in cell wall biosynthesis
MKLSVVMPVFNGARFLDEAIESIVTQDYAEFEFVIVDDGSTDETPRILARWAERDPRIVVIRCDENGGIPRALNLGLARAKGQYIARQDADDLSAPGRFRKQIPVLDANPDVTLVSMNYDLIDEQGNRVGIIRTHQPPEVVEYLLHFSNAIGGHSQVMFRADVVRGVGGYDEDYSYSQDYDLWARLIGRGRLVILPEVGMRYRLHADRVSVTHFDEQNVLSRRVAARTLAQHLERELTEEEQLAVAGVWRHDPRSRHAALAHRVTREVYRNFRARYRTRANRVRARLVIATRFATTAAMAASRGRLVAAAHHFAYSMFWHPLGIFHTAGTALRRLRGLQGS